MKASMCVSVRRLLLASSAIAEMDSCSRPFGERVVSMQDSHLLSGWGGGGAVKLTFPMRANLYLDFFAELTMVELPHTDIACEELIDFDTSG